MHMTTLDSSSSAAESSMDNNASANSRKHKKSSSNDTEDEGDPQVWATFDKSFRQVQSVLDRNRVLIQQVNENHQSKIPENMVKNVALIKELNGNINKVVSLYSDLNTNFSTMAHRLGNKTGDVRSENGEG